MQSGFTLIELMIGVAIIGILAAVATPLFVSYTKKARAAETAELLRHMMDGAKTYYIGTHHQGDKLAQTSSSQLFPVSVGRTPAASCCTFGRKCPGDPSLWDDPSWKAIGFQLTQPHYYRYSFTSTNGAPSTFTARAEGDLDCDGDLSRYTLYGEGGPDGVQSSVKIVSDAPLE